jgi:hypothetical protein
MMAGISTSSDGDVPGKHGMNDALIIKVDQNGNLQWQKCMEDRRMISPPIFIKPVTEVFCIRILVE